MGAFNPAMHPRAPKGTSTGGQFAVAGGKAGGKAPAPSATPGKNGSRYTKAQFKQLQSLQRQHAKGAKLTKQQAHELHVAHELHLQHERAAARPKTARGKKPPKIAVAKPSPKRQPVPAVMRGGTIRAV